jgi:GNAT superfamily N-acetyltransferase
MNMAGYIFDRYNRRYDIEVQEDSGTSFYIKLKDGDKYVGQLLCSFHPGSMMILEDLFIRNDNDAPEDLGPGRKLGKVAGEFQFDFMGGSEPLNSQRAADVITNYRNRGLGRALIVLVFDLARKRQVKTIVGSIIKKDIVRNHHLLKWYINRGFEETGPFKGCIPDAVTWVRFDVAEG